MKKLRTLGFVIGLVAFSVYVFSDLRDFLGFTTLSISEVEKNWGNSEFNPARFREVDVKKRASEIAALLRSRKYVGSSITTVREELGPQDSYYNSDEIPAYSLPKISEDSWHLVFLPDAHGKIASISVRKACCYRGLFTLFR